MSGTRRRLQLVLIVVTVSTLVAAPLAAQSPAEAARASVPTRTGETPKKPETASTAERRKPAAQTTAGGISKPAPAAGMDTKRSPATPSREFLPASQSGLGCAEENEK